MWTRFWTEQSAKNCSRTLTRPRSRRLAFWENGFRHLSNSKVAVKKVEDGKGLKIRTMENKVHLAAWKTAGLNPTPMAMGEVFTALQQKVIDGQENPVAVYYNSKFWDAGQKHFSLTGHVYSPAPFLMSKKIFDAMPKEDQALFKKTAMEMAKFQRKVNRDAEEAKMKEMTEHGVAIVRDVDNESFKKAMAPVYSQFSAQFSKAEIETIMNAEVITGREPFSGSSRKGSLPFSGGVAYARAATVQ